MCKYHNEHTSHHPQGLPADLSLDQAISLPFPTQMGLVQTRKLIPIDMINQNNKMGADEWVVVAWDIEEQRYIKFTFPELRILEQCDSL